MPPDADPVAAAGAGRRVASGSHAQARFLPGAILAGRYRIVGLLGRGGMGEVYRADDLKLGQAVALKFLPPEFETDPDRLKRFLDEVRTARQVSHTNVCRIYDAAEADGHHFLSMEYVDGEDLASLLRRIGRLPKEKAIQIARQLCAGLAASHDTGVLHRDLKPANIMIDGRGRARITDFGLAGFAQGIAAHDLMSGTPAYMAPEQLAGREVSVRSDLYALGLVLYELFTGKQAFAAASIEERRRLQTSTTPSSPSTLVEGFDPAVERVILRCLETDPARRPSSALTVAAALPGGDPLAAALAAGETPSPEMVAEAGEARAASLALAWGALAVFAAGLAACLAMAPRASLAAAVSLDKPPEVLTERAREILSWAGIERAPADSLSAFRANEDSPPALERRGSRPGTRGVASGILFTYRQSPGPLAPVNGSWIGHGIDDPPGTVAGMARVDLDPQGRLVRLLIVPGERIDPSLPAAAAAAWDPLLRATGLDPGSLAPARPELAPPVFADRREAWTGSWPGSGDSSQRVEAASLAGRPVWLRVTAPLDGSFGNAAAPGGRWRAAGAMVNAVLYVSVVITAGFVALRNVRAGRGDRRGALRLALYLGGLRMLWFLGAHHVATTGEVQIFTAHLSSAMLVLGLAYVFYLAVEPYARRLWPRMLVSWVRVLDGRFRDPLVGRDVLIGCAAGALTVTVWRLSRVLPPVFGAERAAPQTDLWMLLPLGGPLHTLVAVMAMHNLQTLSIIFPVTLVLLFRLVLRRMAPALVVVSLLALVMFYPGTGSLSFYVLGYAVWCGILWFVLFRVGLLAFAATFTMTSWIEFLPLMPSPPGWYAGPMVLALACVAAPAIWGFWASRAGRPLFADGVLEPAPRR